MYPLVHEVLPFCEHKIGLLEDVEWYVRKGDIVFVTNGPWRNLVGSVLDRVDGGVVIGEVQHLPTLTNDETEPGVPDLHRQEVVLLLDRALESGEKFGEFFVELNNIHRFLDVGDEIRVKAGQYSEHLGLIIVQQVNTLTVQISLEEPLVCMSINFIVMVNVLRYSGRHFAFLGGDL